MKISFFTYVFLVLWISSCVTSTGWKQEGKTEQDRLRDDGECRAQANQIGGDNPFSINNAYGNCMNGRGWRK